MSIKPLKQNGPVILMIYHGSQRADRVSRLLQQLGYELKWLNPASGDALPENLDAYFAVVVYGGVQSVNDDQPFVRAEQQWINRWIEQQRPYLGLCLGSQFLARALGMQVRKITGQSVETGYIRVEPVGDTPFLKHPMYVFEWHNEGYELPDGCTKFAQGSVCPTQGYYYKPWIVGLQFHPEVTPHVAIEWFASGGHQQLLQGAHAVERQLRDAQVFEPILEQWTTELLQTWLGAAIQNSPQPEPVKEIQHG